MIYIRNVGHACRIVNLFCLAVMIVNHIRHIRYRGYDIHIEFAVKPLLNNFHVQQSQEPAPETKSECYGTFGRECKRSVVELQLLERRTQVFEILR